MKPYLRSTSAGHIKTGQKDDFDDSLEGSTEPLNLTRKKEAIMLQKSLHAAKKTAKDHARSQGSLMATLVRRADRTLHNQLTAQQLEINKMRASNVREDRENRKFRKPTLFDVSMEREKDLELIQELSRSVSREDIKMLVDSAKQSDDMVEPYLRFVQNNPNNTNNNNLDDFLLSINAERVIERIRPSSARPSSGGAPTARQRPYSAAAAATYTTVTTLGDPASAVPNTSAVRVRPSLSAPRVRPTSAGTGGSGINPHMVRYDLTNMHSPRGRDARSSSHAGGNGTSAAAAVRSGGGQYNDASGGARGRRRPSMSDSIDSNMLHVEDLDYFNAGRLPDKTYASGAGVAVSAASAAHRSPPVNVTPVVMVTTPAIEPPSAPLNIHIDLPSIAVSKYVHHSADYSPDSRTTLSMSPLKSNRRARSAGAATQSQRPSLHHNYSYAASLGLQNYTTVSTVQNNSSSMVMTAQTSGVGDDSHVALSESQHRELSGTVGTDSHREIFGYTPVASTKQLPSAAEGAVSAAIVRKLSSGGVVVGGTPEGITADIINDLDEDDPFMLDELLQLNATSSPIGFRSPSSPALSHSKSRRIFPTVELQPRQKNQQQGVEDAMVCTFMRSEVSPTKPKGDENSKRRPWSANGRPLSPASGNRSPLAQRIIQQPRWK